MIWLIVIVLIFVAALNWAFRSEASLRRFTHWAIAGILAVCVALSATGLLKVISPAPNPRSTPAVDSIHRWVGVALPNIIGGLAPLCIAVGVRWLMMPGKRWHGALQIAASLGVFALSFLASLTGYLGPSHVHYNALLRYREETFNRFQVLHVVVLPSMLTCLLAAWLVVPWWSRHRARRRDELGGTSTEESGNPYQSPSSGV